MINKSFQALGGRIDWDVTPQGLVLVFVSAELVKRLLIDSLQVLDAVYNAFSKGGQFELQDYHVHVEWTLLVVRVTIWHSKYSRIKYKLFFTSSVVYEMLYVLEVDREFLNND